MSKIHNPFVGREGYNCFACAPDNTHGLHMEFFEEGEEVVSRWQPQQHHQGWGDILHGGIQTTLMDEIASWTIFAKKHVAGMTTKLEIKFLKPVFVSGGELTVRARISSSKRNLVLVQTHIFDNQGDKVAEGMIYYFTFTPEQAREKLNLPGVEEFYRS
jgi:uncharacterized protein (TIGR00369 family)